MQLNEFKKLVGRIMLDKDYDKIDSIAKDTGLSLSRLYNIQAGKIKKFAADYEILVNYYKLAEVETFETKNNTFRSSGGIITMDVPLVPMKAFAQYIDEFYSEAADITFEWRALQVDQYGKGHYLAFQIEGSSMNSQHIDDTPDGATVLGREIGSHLWSGSLYRSQFGHIIITNRNILFKDIVHHDKETHTVTLHSRNPSPEYSDFKLRLGECDEETYIRQIFKVLSLIHI